MLNIVNPYTFDSAVLPYRVDVMAWSSADATSGVTFTRTQSVANLSGGAASHSNAADADNGDYMEWEFLVDAGTYRLDALIQQGVDRGIFDFAVDGSSLGTVDGYAAATTRNVLASFTGATLAAGHHTVRVTANGKNASSTDYVIALHTITLTRTGA